MLADTVTNAIHYIQIPIPEDLWNQVSGWLSQHEASYFIAAWIATHGGTKLLSKWAGSNKIVDTLIWVLEHAKLSSDVTPLKQRESFSNRKDNGLPPGVAPTAAIILCFLFLGGTVNAQSNQVALTTAPGNISTGFQDLSGKLVSEVISNGQAGSGISYSLRKHCGPELDQSLGIFGYTGTNITWQVAAEHTDAFYGGAIGTQDYLGGNWMLAWKNPPRFLKYCLLNANNISVKSGVGYPTDKVWKFFGGGTGCQIKDLEFSVGINGNWGK